MQHRIGLMSSTHTELWLGMTVGMLLSSQTSGWTGAEKPTAKLMKDPTYKFHGLEGLNDLIHTIAGFGESNALGVNPEEPLCKEGELPVPLAGHHKKMKANGCGPQGFQVHESFGLHKCCNFHDVCFSTCGTSHEFCEKEFRRCMDLACTKPALGTIAACRKQAQSFATLTTSFGRGFHKRSQRESCTCMPEEIAADVHHEYLLEFLKDHDPETATEEAAEELLRRWKGKEGHLYAGLVKKHGHKFINFDNIKEEMPHVPSHHYTLDHEL